MTIYVYSDESGVFDQKNNDIYVYAGVMFIDKKSRDYWIRKYKHTEQTIRQIIDAEDDVEIKASMLKGKEKNKLFRTLNDCYKFGVIIKQSEVLSSIFEYKKTKQRYLDYAYKIAVKRAFEDLIEKSVIHCDDVEYIRFYIDEHTTATNGRYELGEGLEKEFKIGTHNFDAMTHFPPLFKNLKDVYLKYYDSRTQLLIRAADIVANRIYYLAVNNKIDQLKAISNINLISLPKETKIQ